MDFQTCLEQIFKQSKFLWFSIKCGHCRCEGFRQFRNSTDFVVEIGWVTVCPQLLKGQQNLVCFNCRMRLLTAKLWLTCGASLLLLSWGSSRRAVGNLFLSFCRHVGILTNFLLNSCHHVRTKANLFCNYCHPVVTFCSSCHLVRTVVSLFYNSCHQLRTNFWARVLCCLSAEKACFRMKITLGVVLVRSSVIHVCVSDYFRNGSGVRPYLFVQKKLV